MDTDRTPVPLAEDKPTLTPREIATILGCSERTIYRMITNGDLPVITVGRRRVVPTAQLRQWLHIH